MNRAMKSPVEIAKVCHQVNKAYCESIGDSSQVDWEQAPEWQRNGAIDGVQYLLHTPLATGNSLHENWVKYKEQDGWTYGEIKDAEKKTHPCLVPFKELPRTQQAKSALFYIIVETLGEWPT